MFLAVYYGCLMFVADGSQSIIIGTDGSSQSGGVLYNNYQATYISEAD